MTRTLLTQARIATMVEGAGLIDRGCIAIEAGRIVWVGADGPAEFERWPQVDVGGRLVTPALIDCHTHLVHGGHRAPEFEMRLNGATYAEVAEAGGGILSTVKATRATDTDALVLSALPRLDALIAEGVACLEVKSGYGLDIETELRMLRAARKLGALREVRIRTSFLGAHAIPPDFAGDADAYISQICLPALHAAHDEGLVDAVDGFCEGIAFTPKQIGRVFDAARALGLPVKLHAEQLSHQGGAALAAAYRALSADHLEYATAGDARAMADAGTVAVLLPGAFYTLKETQHPPVKAFREHAVPMALATDCNPGSSPLASILLTMNMGCTLFGLTPDEALSGVTRVAARALGLTDCGELRAGLRADLAVWDVESPAELAYRIGFNALSQRIFGGAV
ncbi:imidazolonepropionase [Thalassococcus sp. S3]|uniref:imidazolonepropionase n=1 Tax=Thalassococcus sp. S3 TaxID=2017482 RepID=UPI00102451E9|nr:imidazolonepropionase [Thalassococcus sp. S3]QBF32894.1 imidazolonepropionase [Thalassococcus sp. S3]